ncbi:hypothetical protein ABIA30_004518 [Mycobacterium sp. MAA66]|uniref:DUF7155 family protein n=1 Tax=Mycobacterium sp. MAA66 TaxID=3156297 RepID=UPI003511E922
MTIRASRLCAAGALAVAAVAAPIAVALSAGPSEHAVAGKCLAWIGNKDDGNCVGQSNGQPVTAGTPWGVWGPSGGINSGPLLPGQSWNTPIN